LSTYNKLFLDHGESPIVGLTILDTHRLWWS